MPARSADAAGVLALVRGGNTTISIDRRTMLRGAAVLGIGAVSAPVLIGGADVIRIEAAAPYPYDYDATVERNRHEQDADARPEIAGGVPDLSGYDTVILGCPVWNTRAPMIIRTLLDATDLSGTTVHPFITYAVGKGSVFDDYADRYPDATIAEGLAIQGEKATDAGAYTEQWITDSRLTHR